MVQKNSEILTEIQIRLATIEERLFQFGESLSSMEKSIHGNGRPGLEETVSNQSKTIDRLQEYHAQYVKWFKFCLAGMSSIIMLVLAPAVDSVVNTYFTPIIVPESYNTVVCASTMDADYNGSSRNASDPESTATSTPQETQTITAVSEPTPDGAYNVRYSEIRALAALCWVETRGMADKREEACASVIDTVFERIRQNTMTIEPTVSGVIRYGCSNDTVNCQFPAYVVNGCGGITAPCPFTDLTGMSFYAEIVELYLSGDIVPECGGYLFYGIKEFDEPECSIVSATKQFLHFHNGLKEDKK
jgi:hypothetical protein